MRIRNIEKSFYLSKEENKLLLDKCKKLNLNQSDYIRKIINNYEPKKYDGSIFEKHNNDIKDINLKLEAIIESINKYGYIDKKRGIGESKKWFQEDNLYIRGEEEFFFVPLQ